MATSCSPEPRPACAASERVERRPRRSRSHRCTCRRRTLSGRRLVMTTEKRRSCVDHAIFDSGRTAISASSTDAAGAVSSTAESVGRVKETEDRRSTSPTCSSPPYSARMSCTIPRPSPVESGPLETPRLVRRFGAAEPNPGPSSRIDILALWPSRVPGPDDSRVRPFPRVVEQVADHLAEVVRVDPDDEVDRRFVPPIDCLAPRHVPHRRKSRSTVAAACAKVPAAAAAPAVLARASSRST